MTNKRTIDLEESALHTKQVFDSIYHRFLRRKSVCAERKLSDSTYFTATFNQAKRFPLLTLLKHRCIKSRLNKLEILIKIEGDPYISDSDLESLIIDAGNSPETLSIIITRGNVSKNNLDEISKAFRSNGTLILLLGDPDMSRIEKWVSAGNINACLIYLLMMADGITWVGRRTYIEEYAKAVIEKRLDYMGNLEGQLRTVIKKLEFLLSFEEAGTIKRAASQIGIERKTYYNWFKQDPVFRSLVTISVEMKKEEYFNEDYDEVVEKMEKSTKSWERKLERKNDIDLTPKWDIDAIPEWDFK